MDERTPCFRYIRSTLNPEYNHQYQLVFILLYLLAMFAEPFCRQPPLPRDAAKVGRAAATVCLFSDAKIGELHM